MEVGTLVGQYRITGALGAGGMGTVYVGEHTLLGRRAAIKVLQPALSQQRDSIERFFNEARAAAAINHPGIVQIFDFGFVDDGAAYIVMELLDGVSLADLLHGDGPLPAVDALRIARQVASAMVAAHAIGILHRDLKPDNIFLIPDGDVPGGRRVKILDFGIAKLARAPDVQATSVGTILGTPLYMAPEQFRGSEVDARTDVYALGCVLFETLVGQPPFDSGNVFDLSRLHQSAAPPSLSQQLPALARPIEAIVLRCLAKPAGERFASMADLIEALDAAEAVTTGLEPGSDAPQRRAFDPRAQPAARAAGPAAGSQTLLGPPRGVSPPPAAPSPGLRATPRGDDEPSTDSWVATTGVFSLPRSAARPELTAGAPAPGSTTSGVAMQARSPDVATESGTRGSQKMVGDKPQRRPGPVGRGTPGGAILHQRPTRVGVTRTGVTYTGEVDGGILGPPKGIAGAETDEIAMGPSLAIADLGIEADELAQVFAAAIPAGFRDFTADAVRFFSELFRTARHVEHQLIELGAPAIHDLAARAHFVLFLDDVEQAAAAPFGQIGTQVFRTQVDPFAHRLAALAAPAGSVLITVLAAPQLGQGARETIFTLRKERNLFVVPLAAAELRRACDTGTARELLVNRIADLHTVSDPFAIIDGSADPTRWIGFSAEVSDLVKHIVAGGRIVSVAGPPGSGKTSMVAMAEYGCDTSNVARQFVRIRCGELASHDPHQLVREITNRVRRLQGEPPVADAAAPPDPGTAAAPPLKLRDTLVALGAWPGGAGMVSSAARAYSSRPPVRETGMAKRYQLVLVLDDADWLIRLTSSAEPDDARRVAARELWRGLAELCASGHHTVIVTSVRDFREMEQVPLEQPVSVSRVPMRALTRRESNQLVASLGELVGFRPTRRALAKLHQASGGNVFALRLICSDIIRATRARPDYSPLASLRVTPRQVAAAVERIAATGSSFRAHVSLWLDDTEHVVLQHIAREHPRSPRRVRRALEDVASPEQIAKALDGLELMMLVEHRRGHHRVRIPLFERWINTHLDAPPSRRTELEHRRGSRIAIGFTCTALLFGGYWTWLRSTRSRDTQEIAPCTYDLDYPDRVALGDPVELFVNRRCTTPAGQHLVVLPISSTLLELKSDGGCTAEAVACLEKITAKAGPQAPDIYQIELDVDGNRALGAAIHRDRFATLRAIGEQSVPAISFIPLILALVASFHKEVKKSVARLFGRGRAPATPGPDG